MAESPSGSVEQWTAVERYLTDSMLPADPVLDAVLRASAAAGLPGINVGANQGQLLHLLVRMQHARRVLEVGTLGGYSTIWMARALPANGKLITLEHDAKHADVARANFARAELSDRIELRLGKALDLLPKIAAAGEGPFDLVFIDANKDAIPEYFDWALKLTKPGSVIVVDNVVRKGGVIEAASKDKDIQGVRRFMALLRKEKRVIGTALQTVGSKGYDGFAVLLVVGSK